MEHNIQNLRIPTLKKASPKVQFLYDYISISGFHQKNIEKYDLQKLGSHVLLLVGDIVLGFYRVEDTVPLLQQELGLDPRTAALLGADIIDFLAPLSDPDWQPPTTETRDVTSNIPKTPEVSSPEPKGVIPESRESTDAQDNTFNIPIRNGDAATPVTQPTSIVSTPFLPTKKEQVVTQAPSAIPIIERPPTATNKPSTTPSPFDTPRPMPPQAPASSQFHFEPIYQSTQPNTRQPLSDVPTYQTPQTIPQPTNASTEPPRWETEK